MNAIFKVQSCKQEEVESHGSPQTDLGRYLVPTTRSLAPTITDTWRSTQQLFLHIFKESTYQSGRQSVEIELWPWSSSRSRLQRNRGWGTSFRKPLDTIV